MNLRSEQSCELELVPNSALTHAKLGTQETSQHGHEISEDFKSDIGKRQPAIKIL